jgi:hypothetical protein
MRIKIPPPKPGDFAVGKSLFGTAKHRAEFGVFIDFQYDPPWGIDGLLHFWRTPYPERARLYLVEDRIQAVVTRWDFHHDTPRSGLTRGSELAHEDCHPVGLGYPGGWRV